jgi:hypothetical protein
MNRSQSSLNAFISEANHTDPEKNWFLVNTEAGICFIKGKNTT